MKRKALLLLFAAISVFAVRAQAVPTEAIVSFTGFDFVSPNAPTTPFLVPGDSYFAVGLATSFGPTISGAINGADEHSFILQDAVVGTSAWDGTNLVVNFNPAARIRFYEDPSHDYAYGTNPPNATSPSTFIDGSLILGAQLDNLVLVYSYDATFGNTGTFYGTATLDEGADLVVVPPTRRAGWVLSGTIGQPNPSVPAGYVNQVEGELQIPDVTPTAQKTWGSIKALYR